MLPTLVSLRWYFITMWDTIYIGKNFLLDKSMCFAFATKAWGKLMDLGNKSDIGEKSNWRRRYLVSTM